MKKHNWIERFSQSLQLYEKEIKNELAKTNAPITYGMLTGELDRYLLQLTENKEYSSEMLSVMSAPLLKQAMLEITDVLERFLNYCESEIERHMAVALWIVGQRYTCQANIDLAMAIPPRIPDPETVIIRPQAKLGEYRADFLVTYCLVLPKFKPDGEFIRNVEVCKQMVVECDGHDFHERTKEQESK